MSGDSYFAKTMSATVEISDGITTIEDGNITANSITTNTFNTNTFQASTLTDGYATIQNGNITGVNTLSCNEFITSSFSTPYISVDTLTSTTINNQYYNLLDTTANLIAQIYNQGSTFVSTIYTSAMSNGWKFYYNPTSTTCMTLDISGNLKTNSLQPLTTSSTFNILTNQITGAITNIGSSLSTIIFLGTIKANTISPNGTGVTVNTFTFGANNATNSNNQTNVNLFIDNIAPVNIGGSGGVNLAKQGSYYVEVGSQNYSPFNAYIDFHTINVPNDYDCRIIASGGNSVATGGGTMDILTATTNLTSGTNITITAPIITLSTPKLNINTNQFRFIPWTTLVGLPSSTLSNVMNFPTGANCPTPSSTATLKYRYSVIGNTLYVNYYYYSGATAGTNGNGVYQYLIPSVVTINTNDIIFTSTTSAYGTVVGNTTMKQVGSSNGIGKVYITNSSLNVYGFMLSIEMSNVVSLGVQGSSYYPYGYTNLFYQFDAMIPIV